MPGIRDIFKRKDVQNEVVKASIRKAVLDRLQNKNPQVTLVIKEGEYVPESLKNLKDMKITDLGTAASDWCNSWGDSKDGWGEGWGECFPTREGEILGRPDELVGGFHITQVTNVLKGEALNAKLKEVFSSEEIQILKKHNII